MRKDSYVYGDDVRDEYPGVSITIERIYPETAKQMLRHNVGNRKFKSRHNVALAIQNDEWSLNGATIVFAEDGRLLDGQHRLQACLKTGKPIDSVVVRGVETQSQVSMDSGAKRSVSDFLRMRGYGNVGVVSGIGYALLRADTYGLDSAVSNNDVSRQFTTMQVLEFIEKAYPDRIEPVKAWASSLNKKYRGYRTSIIAAVLDAIRDVADDDDVRGFVDQLRGTSVATGSVAVLQRRLYANALKDGKSLSQRYLAAITIKAWNDYAVGDSHEILSFRGGGANPESFPVPVGPVFS